MALEDILFDDLLVEEIPDLGGSSLLDISGTGQAWELPFMASGLADITYEGGSIGLPAGSPSEVDDILPMGSLLEEWSPTSIFHLNPRPGRSLRGGSGIRGGFPARGRNIS